MISPKDIEKLVRDYNSAQTLLVRVHTQCKIFEAQTGDTNWGSVGNAGARFCVERLDNLRSNLRSVIESNNVT